MAKMKRNGKSAGVVSKPNAGSEPSSEMRRLEEVFRLMTSYGVGEVELEDENGRLHARMPSASPAYSVAASAPAAMAVSAPVVSTPSILKDSASAGAKAGLSANQKKILSPFVGTFYRSSNPNAAPYASEGQKIRKGQTLCIIEAMKLMNEIESEFDGKIVSILVENGQPVEFGEALFIIES
jgi:acetyl-CoA carboxylase biotin carboxyl carrier protein